MPTARAKCIGILTSGGDCPGLNAAIRGVAKPAISEYHIEVIGIEKGFRGLVENHSRVLHLHDISGILSLGGTILGSARCPEFKSDEGRSKALRVLREAEIDALVVIGGSGSQNGSPRSTRRSSS